MTLRAGALGRFSIALLSGAGVGGLGGLGGIVGIAGIGGIAGIAGIAADAYAEEPLSSPSALAAALGAGEDAGFAKALEPRTFAFPDDHGPHPSFRNEWWYLTGNLDGEDGRRFGYELTIFRVALAPEAPESPGSPESSESPESPELPESPESHQLPESPGPPESASAWRTNQIFFAHFALTDARNGEFHVAERWSRGAAGLAGAEAEPFRVWLADWSIAETAGAESAGTAAGTEIADTATTKSRWRLLARDGDVGIDVTLEPAKPPVLQGDAGLSQKSSEPGNASYYYSLTRLGTDGAITLDGQQYRVAGWSWLDREWSTSALAPEQAGWDWFALQLDDGTELMFYLLRRRNTDGNTHKHTGKRTDERIGKNMDEHTAIDPHSAGSFVDAAGRVTRLAHDDVRIDVTDNWQSPLGGSYPARWTLRVPKLALELEIVPVIANQELDTIVRYWEGAVDASGTRDGRPIGGRGYVELTGYATAGN